MADAEQAQPVVEQEAQTPTPEQAQPDATGEKAERVFKQSEVEALIRERLASAQRKADDAAKKATAEAEARALKEQGEYQKLFEQAQAELEAERQRAKGLELAGMRRDVAAKFQLPDGLAKRLQGETLEDLERDAQDLLANMPKPPAPNINAGNASGKTPVLPGGMTDATIKEQATRLNVPFEAFKAALLNGRS